MTLSEIASGEITMTQERILDEYREVYYRRTDQAAKHLHHVGIERLGMVQGEPGDDKPRYGGLQTPCRDPGEADGRVAVKPLAESKFPKIAMQLNGY